MNPDLELLSKVVDDFGGDVREGQQQMVQEVATALEDGANLLIQAGTGTGKSLGYLVPAMRRALERDERIVVSTATLALQRQILLKDAPQVNRALGDRVNVAVLKGWRNYLCLQKAKGGYPDEGLFAAEEVASETGAEVIRLRKWADQTQTGDRDDLTPGVSERAWQQVSVDTRECMGQTCPMRDECFAARARVEATEAHLVITNHSMLGIHAATDNQVCGEFDALIVDEAHDLARIIRGQATLSLSANLINYRSRRLSKFASITTSGLEKAAEALDAVLDGLDEGLVTARPENLNEAMRVLDTKVREASSDLEQSSAAGAERKMALAALSDLLDYMDQWDRDPERMITWVSRSEDSPTYLNCAPLDVAGPIARNLLSDRAAVLTSATMQLGGSFDGISFDTGAAFASGEVRSADVGTPFDPPRQGILYVAEQLPPPGRGGVSDEALAELVDLAKASGGGVLALFSSRAAAEQGAAVLRENLDVNVFSQGEDQLGTLLKNFAEDEDSCLVGTLSLWQGIDVRGKACRLVTIDRIPFPVPSDPVVQARTRHVAKAGRNAFREVSLNHAALLLSQGVGRLLRSREDRGVVAILDSRIATRSYGSYLMHSLPNLWPTKDGAVARRSLENLREKDW
ncbi:MAG: ATP-dependent DNA helicase [Actinomycetaceae bacterium]|nr:ATP-dependent DNA helicase [Actinomycetaceae bacterium]